MPLTGAAFLSLEGLYKCHLQRIAHVRGGEYGKVTLFDISPKFTLFWGHIGAKPGVKKGKNVPLPIKHGITVVFRE